MPLVTVFIDGIPKQVPGRIRVRPNSEIPPRPPQHEICPVEDGIHDFIQCLGSWIAMRRH